LGRSVDILTVTDEVEGGLSEVGQSADLGRRQIIDGVRVVSERYELADVDEVADADDDEVDTGPLGQERFTVRP